MNDEVHIVEVGPRDGLQNEKSFIPTSQKINFLRQLFSSGLKHIELTSLVSPKAVPQMSDAEDVLKTFANEKKAETYALVLNMKGYERLQNYISPIVALGLGVSNAFNEKNIRMNTEETLRVISEVFEFAKKDHRPCRVYISTSFGCPYQGKISLTEFMNLFHRLLQMGFTRFSIGDTIGVATPLQIKEWVSEIKKETPQLQDIALHLHDTYGRALVNCFVGFEQGIRWFDSSAGGLGGCPYAAGATGNVATEDLIDLFQKTNIPIEGNPNIEKISKAVEDLVPALGHLPSGHLFQAWHRKKA